MSIRQRDYQREARAAAFAAWDRGERAHLMAAPTGAGKTLVEAKLIEEWHAKDGGRILVLAQDSRELVRQLAAVMRRHTRLAVGIEMGTERVSRVQPPTVVCATVQTMSKRIGDFKRDAFTLIVQDEADHAAAKTWRKISDHFWTARIFGCTATPNRHDGRRIPFDSARSAATHAQLIDGGLIAPIEVRDVRVVDRKLIVLPSGEHPTDVAAVARVWEQEGELHEIVEPTIRIAGERPTIVFAATVSRARDIAAMFNRYRCNSARAVWSSMPRDERAETMTAYHGRRFQYIVNVGVLGRGIDLPFVSCVVMARVTQSRTVYEQAIGRGWRAYPGKDRLLVLDFCENADRHRLISTVALLTGRVVDGVTIERAGERLDEAGGGDVAAALDDAERDLLDEAVRARVRAKVAVRMRTVDLLVESITEEEWRTKPSKQIARETGLSLSSVRARRPKHIPSPMARFSALLAPPIFVSDEEFRTKSNKQIATDKGVTPTRISRLRKTRGVDRDLSHLRSSQRLDAVSSITETQWAAMNNNELAHATGINKKVIARARPAGIPSPGVSKEGRLRAAKAFRKAWESKTEEERAEHRRRCGEAAVAAIEALSPEEKAKIRTLQSGGGRYGASRSSRSRKRK